MNDTTCALRIKERCPAFVADYADEVQRAVLDGKNAHACADIMPGCDVRTAQMFNTTFMREINAFGLRGEEEEAPKPMEETAAFKKTMGGGGGGGGLESMMAGNDDFAKALKDLKIEL